MNRFRKIFFLIIFAVFFIGIISPIFVFAAEPPKTVVNFCPQIDIPFIDMFDTKKYPCKEKKDPITGARSDAFHINTSSIAELAAGAYKFIAGIAGIAAVIVMMAGGYVWLFAGGNASKVGEAKSLIGSAVLGLFLVLGSYMILNLINPELIELKSLDDIGNIGNIETNITTKICDTAAEIAANNKSKANNKNIGCGLMDSVTGCMRTLCYYPNNSAEHYICVLNADRNGRFTGGGCKSSITVRDTVAMENITLRADSFAGNSLPCGTKMNDTVSQRCEKDEDYLTCTAIIQDGQKIGLNIDNSSAGLCNDGPCRSMVQSVYKNKVVYMGCRSAMSSVIK